MSGQIGCMVVGDSTKCTGCRACEIACFAAHDRFQNGFGHTVGTVTVPVTPRLYLVRGDDFCVPVQCKHCEDAPCLNACEEGAIRRTGHQVIIDKEKCIGCKDCMMACPFGAIYLLPETENGKLAEQECGDPRISASKCDLCYGLKGEPACVRICPNGALRLADPEADFTDKQQRAAASLAIQSNPLLQEGGISHEDD